MNVLSSRRRRRRLTIAAVFVVVAIPLGYLAVHYSNSASPRDANGPYVSDAFYRQPKHAPFTAEKRRAVSAVLAKFISGAVSKHDLAGTWDLAGPDLRQGMTRDDWLKGQLPIVPFAASERGQGKWSLVSYSYANKVGLEPPHVPGAPLGPAGDRRDRRRPGERRPLARELLDDHEAPRARLAAAADSASALSEGPPNVHKLPGKKKGQTAGSQREAAPDRTGQVAHLDAKWLLVPLGIVALALLALLGIGINAWRRNRRSAAAWARPR